MGSFRKVLIVFLVVLASQIPGFYTAKYLVGSPNPVETYDDKDEIVIKPSSVSRNGETYVQGLILPHATVTVSVDFKKVKNATFLILQAHSFISPLVLSSAVALKEGNNMNGTDIGLYYKLIPSVHTVEFYLTNPNNVTVGMMLVPVFYSEEDPVPGGCNLNFPVNIAPFMTLTFDSNYSIVQVDAQPASAKEDNNCQQDGLSYEVYEFYTSDFSAKGYFDAILSMITAEKAAENGIEFRKPMMRLSGLRRRFGTYPGSGSIYVVTVRNAKTGKSAAYVPISNYNCVDRSDGCRYNNLTALAIWMVTFSTGVFLLTEIRFVFQGDSRHAPLSRSLFVICSLLALSPIFPKYWGLVAIGSMSIITATFTVVANSDSDVTLWKTFIDQFYVLVPAHITTVSFIFPAWFYFFDEWSLVTATFLAYLFFFHVFHRYFSWNYGCIQYFYALFMLFVMVSGVIQGSLLHAYMDVSRFLTYELSDVMFYPPVALIDRLNFLVWPAVGAIYVYGRYRLKEQLSSGGNLLIINEPPILSSKQRTYDAM